MKNFNEIKIIARAESKEEGIKFEYFITSDSLFDEEGEILARYDKRQNEMSILLDDKASEVLTFGDSCEYILKAFKEGKFLPLGSNQSIYRMIVKNKKLSQ